MRSIRYRRAQRARIKQRRRSQFMTKMTGYSYLIPVEDDFENSKAFKIAIDTPKSCSCHACSGYKCLRKQEQSYLKVNGIDVQLKDMQNFDPYALSD